MEAFGSGISDGRSESGLSLHIEFSLMNLFDLE
jgi:hypothetical protein